MTGAATLAMIGIDRADPRALAHFYHQILGWTIVDSKDEYALIRGDGVPIVFWRVDEHQPPRWPHPGSPSSSTWTCPWTTWTRPRRGI